MKIIRLNELSLPELKDKLYKLKYKLLTAKLKVQVDYLLEDILSNRVEVLLTLDENSDILGWMLLFNKIEYVEIQILEAFTKNKGVGTYLMGYIKNRYNRLKAESILEAVDFYLKNDFKAVKKYNNRVLVEWTR